MRLDHADGTHDPLLMTAIFLEDSGRQAWLVAADLVQFPDGEPFRRGMDAMAVRLGCSRDAFFLNASHTHGGPEMNPGYAIPTPAMMVQRSPRNQALIERYHDFLWDQLAEVSVAARDRAFEGRLVYGAGKTTFPMNRRALIGGRIENAPNPDGPIEDRLRLLGVEDEAGRLRALGLILAAHPTATGAQHQFTADFVGAWRDCIRMECDSGVEPFFLQACAGDMRPAFTREGDHWRRVSLSELKAMGAELARETAAVLRSGLQPLADSCLRFGRSEVLLKCQPRYTKSEDCRIMIDSEVPWEKEFAEEACRRFGRGEVLPDRVTVPLTWLQLSRDLSLLGMGCEPLVALGRKIEAALANPRVVLLGYTNGCNVYVPDTEELKRGGYEAESYLFDGFCGPFEEGLEEPILEAFRELYRRDIQEIPSA